jgi:NAD(P)-dependent dehydrogenase (short-subunit alcohol dehydrogenase family)
MPAEKIALITGGNKGIGLEIARQLAGHHRGYRTVEQAAVIAVRLATLPTDGPTGTFQDENGPVPW